MPYGNIDQIKNSKQEKTSERNKYPIDTENLPKRVIHGSKIVQKKPKAQNPDSMQKKPGGQGE